MSASQTLATVYYDSTSRGYTLTIGGRSLTFLPSDIDASQSSATVTAYVRKNGATTDSLTLTKPGTSGRFTYKYVGAGFWQRTITGSSAISGSFDAFTYGVATPLAAVPRTGQAEYQVDLIGAQTTNNNVFAITGQGTTQIDFASGSVVTHGTSTGANSSFSPFGPATFSSEARLSSANNSFSGNFRFSDILDYAGSVNGHLYGPSAEEIGAAFSATIPGGSTVVVGTLTGRGAPVTTTNANVTSPTANEFFTNDATKLTVTLKGISGMNNNGETFSAAAAGSSPLVINYDTSSKSYTVLAPDRTQYFPAGRSISIGTITEDFGFTTPNAGSNAFDWFGGYPYPTFYNIQYTASQRWRMETRGTVSTQYRIEDVVYGAETPDLMLPRTGTAGYAIGISGIATDADFSNFAKMVGFGFLTADFASGTLSTSGRVEYREEYLIAGRAPGTRVGTFNGNASISSTTNSFTGPINFDGLGSYSGTMNGRFYGPYAQEVGAAFSASDGAGGMAEGTFVGRIDPAAITIPSPISELTTSTSFAYDKAVFSAGGPFVDMTEIIYDPASSTYTISFSNTFGGPSPFYRVALSPANRDGTASNASFDAFTGGTVGGTNYTATLLKPAPTNPTIALTYTSLAILQPPPGSLTGTPNGTPYYIAFGLPTSSSQMPKSGTATYTGIARGTGVTTTNVSVGGATRVTTFYDVSGTASLVANFSDATINSTLNLSGKDINSDASRTFTPVTAAGNIRENSFSASGIALGMNGHFYGPHAEEFGAGFSFNGVADNNGTSLQINGAVVGKR